MTYSRGPFRSRFWRASVEDEVDAELAFHLDMRTSEYIARGLDPAAAREEAMRRFGDLDRVHARCREIGRGRDRDMRRREYVGELRQDLTFACRQLVRSPGFSLVAILTLALGIGATTAIFSAVHAVVLRPLPLPDVDRLVFVTEEWRGVPADVSAGNFTDVRAESTSFDDLAAVQYSSFNLAEGDAPERVIGARVTASFFGVLGGRPALGRTFRAEEDEPGRSEVAVLSHRLWVRRFGADPAVMGREIRMNGRPHTILGVMPAAFDLTADSEELWVPIAFTPERKAMHDEHYLTVYGRLKRGVPRERGEAELAAIAERIRQRVPRDAAELHFRVLPLMEQFVGDYRRRLLILLGAVGFVLLIACGNVANLLLARGSARAQELGIRAALGAGRMRIVRQLLTESAVLATLASAAGLALAWIGIDALVAVSPEGVPRLEQTRLDASVVAFTVVVAAASSFMFGLAPALRAARTDVQTILKEGGRSAAMGGIRDRLRTALIVGEVAIALLLLVGAGLLIRSAIELQQVDPGFEPTGVFSARLALPAVEYREPERVVLTFHQIVENVGRVPGVEAAAIVSQAPMGRGGNTNGLIPEGRPLDIKSAIQSGLKMISPPYFRTLGIPIRRGRGFDDRDRAGTPKVMIISEALARAAWPGQDPIGKRIACCEPGPDGGPDWKQVVGVAGDVRSQGLGVEPSPEFYLPIEQVPPEAWDWVQRSMYIVARTSGDPAMLAGPVRRVIAGIDPGVPLFDMRPMRERLAESMATARFNMLMLTILGVIGLLLAAVGIYGVIAYFVSQRTHEIGVRMALGATRRDVVALVVRQAAWPVVVGIGIGLAGAALATRVLASQLFGVRPTDPLTFGLVVLALAGVALVASSIPAGRAASIDPTRALHAL